MSHISEVAAQYRIPIDRFIDAAERYCAFIEAWAAEPRQWEPLTFLKAVEPLLAEVAACSAGLPSDGELFSEEEDHEYELPDLETGVGLPSPRPKPMRRCCNDDAATRSGFQHSEACPSAESS